MFIREFIDVYCPEIEQYIEKESKDIFSSDMFPYDDIIEIREELKKIIFTRENKIIEVDDLFCIGEEDFYDKYPGKDCKELRDSYLSNFIIVEGEELFKQILNRAKKEEKRMQTFNKLELGDW